MDVTETLNTYNKSLLNAMAKAFGIAAPSKDRKLLAEELAQQMGDRAAVERSLAALAPNERALLERIQVAGGEISVGALRAVAQRDGLVDPPQRNRNPRAMPVTNSRVFEELAARLTAQGLMLTTGPRGYGGLLNYELLSQVHIPPPVLALLPSLPRDTSALIAPAPPQIRSADPAVLQRDLYLYWSYARDNAVTLTNRGLVSKNHLKKINALMSQPEDLDKVRDENDTGRLRFLRSVLMECELLRRQNDLLVPASNSESFFARPLATRVRAAFNAYRKGTFWDELVRVPDLFIEGRKSSDSSAASFVVNGRKYLLTILGDMPTSDWIDLGGFVDRVKRVRYEFLLPRKRNPYGYSPGQSNPYATYGNDFGWSFYQMRNGQHSYEGYIRDEGQGWDIVEAGMIEELLREPLHWLGLLDLGIAPESGAPWGDRLVAVRATPLGAHVLMDEPLPEGEEQPTGRLITQPTFQVLAYPPVSEVQLALLDRIAERGRLEQVAEYRLTRESLYRARQQYGLTVEQVIDELQRESGQPLPQNVAYTLLEWGRAQDRVQLYDHVALLRVDAPALLDELLETRHETDSPLLRRLTPTVALVQVDALDQVEAELFALGQLPIRTVGPPDLDAGSTWLSIEPDGQISFRLGAPRVYLQRELLLFAAEAGTGLRITAASVRQAVADGMPLETILGQLKTWSAHELPPELERQIKAWGGLFGSASIERPMLLRLSDERALAALLDDPELAPLLQPYRPTGVLAEVDATNLPLLIRALAERGVELTGDASHETRDTREDSEQPSNPKSKIQNPKSP